MEQLQSLLMDCRGPDAEEVKAFFRLHRLDQACATCLVLACCRSPGDAQVSRVHVPPVSCWPASAALAASFLFQMSPTPTALVTLG